MQGVYEKVNNLDISKLEDETFLKVLKKFDILCLQETHLGENDIPDVPDDYVPIPHCRKMSGNRRYFGGMLLLVRKSIGGLITIHKDFDQSSRGLSIYRRIILRLILSGLFSSLCTRFLTWEVKLNEESKNQGLNV